MPSKTRVLKQIAPESSPERSAKSLSCSFFVVPFLFPPKNRSILALRHPQPPTGNFGPFGPEVSRGVSEGVSPKIGVSERVSGGVSRGPRVSKRCPESVSGVSGHLFDTPETLSGHLLDTLGPEGPPRHSPGHSLGHPDFRGHSPGHFGPEGPEASCGGLGMSQSLHQTHPNLRVWLKAHRLQKARAQQLGQEHD